MVTKEQAETLPLNEIHYHDANFTTAGVSKAYLELARQKCYKWRRNGQTKTWKTKPNEFKVPIKYGIRVYAYLTHENADKFFLPEECTNKENHVRR